MLTLVSLPNLDQFSEPTIIPAPINLEIESPILGRHILLMGKECKIEFFDLDSILKPKLTLKSKIDFLKLVLVSEPITLEPKSTIHPSHILLLDIGINHDDSVIFFKTGHVKGISFMIGSFMILFILGTNM